jgi:hypothetical protein
MLEIKFEASAPALAVLIATLSLVGFTEATTALATTLASTPSFGKFDTASLKWSLLTMSEAWSAASEAFVNSTLPTFPASMIPAAAPAVRTSLAMLAAAVRTLMI